MTIRETLSELNSTPHVGGTVLCTHTGRIIFQELSDFSNEDQRGIFSQTVVDIFHKLDESDTDFVEMFNPESRNTWIAERNRGLILMALLYPEADLYMVKLQLSLVLKQLNEEKEVKKILAKEATVLITTIKQVRILDVIQFQDYLKREGITKGVILTKLPYDDRVKEEMAKPNKRMEIIVTDDLKERRKVLTKKYKDQGFSVSYKTLVTDRGM